MIQLNERQRIAAYQRGWNDAQKDRAPRTGESITYQIGYIEALKRVSNRFVKHEAH